MSSPLLPRGHLSHSVQLTLFQADHPGIGTYVSKLRSHEMFPWADWITKHLIDTYGSLGGIGGPAARVKELDLLQIKEHLR